MTYLQSRLDQREAELDVDRAIRAEAETAHRAAHEVVREERQAALRQLAESSDMARCTKIQIVQLEGECRGRKAEAEEYRIKLDAAAKGVRHRAVFVFVE